MNQNYTINILMIIKAALFFRQDISMALYLIVFRSETIRPRHKYLNILEIKMNVNKFNNIYIFEHLKLLSTNRTAGSFH